MLPRTQRMELLSKAYVRALVAQAGGICMEPVPDFGIDFTIHRVVKANNEYIDQGAALDLQLKSTAETEYRSDQDAFACDLEVKAYNFLRTDPVKSPRFLVLFVMPSEESSWVHQDHDGLLLRHCAYYLSLQGMPRTKNEHTIRVMLPRGQVLSVSFLQHHLQRNQP